MQGWIRQETRKRKASHWGEEVTFKPAISSRIAGDGLQLIYVGTMEQRPYYWLMLIDSKTDLDDSNFDVEEYVESLESEFGRHPDCILDRKEFYEALKDDSYEYSDIHYYENYRDYKNACKYPAIYACGGYHYGTVVNFGTGEVGR